jgi:hypothetical protein
MTNETKGGANDAQGLAAWELSAWSRLRAGMLVEQGNADKGLSKTWQDRVRSGDFDADRCTREILAVGAVRPAAEEAQALQRATRLERDLIMTPLLRGASGASRKVRRAAKSGVAAILSQFIVLGIFMILGFFFLLVMSFRGVEFDPFFQAIIDFIPAMESTEGGTS